MRAAFHLFLKSWRGNHAFLLWQRDVIRSRWYERFVVQPGPHEERMALTTVVNDDFVPYLAVLVHSLRRHNPDLSYPWIVFWNAEYSPLSIAHRELLLRLYPFFEFREIDADRYRIFFDRTPRRLWAALFTLEAFSLYEYDRVWFIDADIVCLGDVSALWQRKEPIVACLSGNSHRDKLRYRNLFAFNGGFNTGLFSLSGPYLNRETYTSLFDVTQDWYEVADQDIMNAYFRGRPVYLLPHAYNYHAEFFWDQHGAQEDIRLLHYAGAKPIVQPDMPRMKPWWEAAEKACQDHPFLYDCIKPLAV